MTAQKQAVILRRFSVGPLDLVPTAAAAYSVARQLRQNYTGPLIRIRRASDNVELDIYPTSFGILNTAAAALHIGASTGLITTLYDQSGNARNLVQATAGLQPLYQTDRSALFDGTDDMLQTLTFTLAQPASVFAYFKMVAWVDTDTIIDGFDATHRMTIGQTGVTPAMVLYAGTAPVASNTALAVGAYGQVRALFSGAGSQLSVNNGTATTGNPGTQAPNGVTWGDYAAGGFAGNVRIKEMIVYPVATTAAQNTLIYQNQIAALAS